MKMNKKNKSAIIALANDNLRNTFRLTLLLVPISAVCFGMPTDGRDSFFSSSWMVAFGSFAWLFFEGIRIYVAKRPRWFRGTGGLALILAPVLLMVVFFSIAVSEEKNKANFLNVIILVGVSIVIYESVGRWKRAN